MSIPVFDSLMDEIHESERLPKTKQNAIKQIEDEEREDYKNSKPIADPEGWDWELQLGEESKVKFAAATIRKFVESYQRGQEWYNCIKVSKKGNKCKIKCRVHPKFVNKILKINSCTGICRR
jgi:hypothetical protein